jgi:hypothetical protein
MQLAQPKVHLDQAVRVPGRQAVDPELNFDLYDELKLATEIQDKTHTSIETRNFTR